MTKTAQQAFKETAEKDIKYRAHHDFIYEIDTTINESINRGQYGIKIPVYSVDEDILPDIVNYYKAFGYQAECIRGFFDEPIALEVRWYD